MDIKDFGISAQMSFPSETNPAPGRTREHWYQPLATGLQVYAFVAVSQGSNNQCHLTGDQSMVYPASCPKSSGIGFLIN